MSDDNSGSTIELNRRRVLGALGTVGVASAGAGAGTFALFSDTETSGGNSVQAGTLNLTTTSTQSFNASATDLAPGGSTNPIQIDLSNAGTVSGDHVEVSVDYSQNDGSEPSDGSLSANVTAEEFAERLFVSTLDYAGDGIGLGPSAFQTFTSEPEGAAVIDIGGDGVSDVQLSRVPDPAGGSREDVVLATSNGSSTDDYAISMRSVPSTNINGISAGDITFDYYGGAGNSNAPDEVYVVVNDSGGTNRLVYTTGNTDSPASQQWETRDVGAEIAGAMGIPGENFNWFEVAPSDTTYSDPSSGGLSSDLDGTIEAVGFGRGTTGGGDTIETYYDNLVVNGTSYEFRPVSLDDIASRGKFDSLASLSGTSRFEAQFELDRLAGNDFQGDGVDIQFTFGLAQNSGQSVL
ncbi:CalY family protein [Halobaculum sp. CBA1158]|uniref:TasA family protein n=1 Tax=Halobaculum sp. CBA1158 TaxID=2904243 RepID=UPI001F43801A|nr:TasA family protein [Halobaculum sp. CBA1158]UIO99192.1 CalY family protein [Halobaculum sp. CBA1158]